MPRPSKGRLDQLAPDKITTSVMIDELRSKIQLAGNHTRLPNLLTS